MFIKRFFVLLLFAYLFFPLSVQAANSSLTADSLNIDYNHRSDSVNILHNHVNLKITSLTLSPISGYSQIKLVPKVNNIHQVTFDLLMMTIDSVVMNNNLLNYSYNDTLLHINLGNNYNISDTLLLTIAYHGIPVTDASGFGGFSFSSGYAYNLGVGFSANPHVYGRVWHPCFDNFVERATYSFEITTLSNHKAVCNGLLTNSTINPDSTKTWQWQLSQEIPSYLACVAVSNYATVHQTFNGSNGIIPVELTANPSDTTNMKNSFVHLENAFHIFENKFGPYLWDKVGYVLVPFNGGAMEHATNIAYPRLAVTSGSTLYEADLMAHELAHHWFGDLVTCKTAEDMWLNEGWASFASYIFIENLSGYEAYKNAIRSNHAQILQFTHLKEGGYRPVSGIPHEYTYGDHVYMKGADMAHTIRAYLGDSLFFNGLKQYFSNHAFSPVTSYTLRDELANYSRNNLNDSIENWVFNPGFAHFSIDSFSVSPLGNTFDVNVYVRQRLTGAPQLFNNVPLEITFMNNAFEKFVSTVIMSGQTASFNITVPFNPSFIALNMEAKISDASVSQYKVIKNTGVSNYPDLKISFNISQLSDSVLLRVTHNFVQPDPAPQWTGYKASPNRYFLIDGIFPSGFKGTATVIYDGRSTSPTQNQFLDNMLFTQGFNEDSLVLLYRSSTAQNWSEYPYYTKAMGNANDKFGTVKLDSILKGEYTFGMRIAHTGISKYKTYDGVKISPNPTKGKVKIDFSSFSASNNIIELNLYNFEGRWIKNLKIESRSTPYELSTEGLSEGIYLINMNDGIYQETSKLIIIN